MIRLLCTVPVSKAKLEKMFSKSKRDKSNLPWCQTFGKYFENYETE